MAARDADYRPALTQALESSLAYLDSLGERPVGVSTTLAEMREALAIPLAEDGVDAERVIMDLVAASDPGIVASSGGRFYAWVIGGSLPAAIAADWMVSTWDQNAGAYACSPAAATVEEAAAGWLKELLGLPAEVSCGFVTGCNMANTTCLAAARHALLARREWDVERQGLAGSPPIRVLTSPAVHGSLVRAARFVGLGTDAIIKLEADDRDQLRPEALEAALRESDQPTIVLLQAGDINIAAFDDFAMLIPLAKKHGAWVHIDGAFGLWAAVSANYRHLVAGVELADSWATDGHKWLNVPYDCGYAFVRDTEAHRASMGLMTAYVDISEDAREATSWNPEWSRRARGFPTYAAIRQLGRKGVEAMIDRCCRHCLALTEGIGGLPGVEILWRPHLNQGLVRFGDSDEETDRVIAASHTHGGAFFTGTVWRGQRAMRISVCNWQTTDADVEVAIQTVGEILTAGS